MGTRLLGKDDHLSSPTYFAPIWCTTLEITSSNETGHAAEEQTARMGLVAISRGVLHGRTPRRRRHAGAGEGQKDGNDGERRERRNKRHNPFGRTVRLPSFRPSRPLHTKPQHSASCSHFARPSRLSASVASLYHL